MSKWQAFIHFIGTVEGYGNTEEEAIKMAESDMPFGMDIETTAILTEVVEDEDDG